MATRRILSPNKNNKKRILIVDDHPIMRRGQLELINREEDMAVCGEASSAAAAMAAVAKLRPDLVVLDLSLPDKNGLEWLKDFRASEARVPVLAVSMQDESYYAVRVLRAGGQGYLMKHEGPDQLIAAIRKVLGGQLYISERVSARIVGSVVGNSHPQAGSPVDRLSDRELEVLSLFGEGWSVEEIAQKLHLSHKTVDVHRANIKQKLNLDSTPAFLRFAIRWTATCGQNAQVPLPFTPPPDLSHV
jgi:DNA-binding NarL/FixJ family response regulator